jgi:hypothetical protein
MKITISLTHDELKSVLEQFIKTKHGNFTIASMWFANPPRKGDADAASIDIEDSEDSKQWVSAKLT